MEEDDRLREQGKGALCSRNPKRNGNNQTGELGLGLDTAKLFGTATWRAQSQQSPGSRSIAGAFQIQFKERIFLQCNSPSLVF